MPVQETTVGLVEKSIDQFKQRREEVVTKLDGLMTEVAPLQEELTQIDAMLTLFERAEKGESIALNQTTRRPTSSKNAPVRANLLGIIRETPGLRIEEIATKMDHRGKGYLYRLGSELVEEGLVTRNNEGRYDPVAGAMTVEEQAAQETVAAEAA